MEQKEKFKKASRKQKAFRRIRHANGFTLLEVMAVVAIIGIMSAVLFVSVDRDSGKLETASRQLSTDIRSLQRSALSGSAPPALSGQEMCGFGIHRDSSSQYRLYVITKTQVGSCQSGYGKTFDENGDGYAVRTLETGTTITGPEDVYFEAPHAKMFEGGDPADSEYVYEFERNEKSRFVCVSETGDSEEKGNSGC